MNKSRKTSNLYNVVTYDETGNIVVPAGLTLGTAPASSDNSSKAASTAWIRTYLAGQSYATTVSVDAAISAFVDAAPTTLDTLNELAAALGDDPNFATTVTTSIGTKVPQARTITINGTAYDLSADRSWTIAAGLTSFNTRTGAITLTSGDVTTALGFTPYNATNPSGYITGITSGMVTTALGFTPVTNARTITINGTAYDLSADRAWTISGSDSTKLPLTGGSLSGPLTITGNGTYLGDWGYKTLELNDTSGYPGILFRNGSNVWIFRRDGPTSAMDWAHSSNATAQGTGTFTQKMRLATDEWWVSTYPNYKMRITGGDVIESLNGTSATTLYLQYHSNTGGNVNIAASKFIFYNTGEFSLGGGSSSGQSQLSSGLTAIRFPNQYSSGYTDAGVKLYIFNSGSTIQGFTAGPAYDLQYHSSGSDSGRHAFYVANSEVIRFNKTLVLSAQNFAVGNQQGFDNPGGWNKNILIDGTNHGRFRIKASNHTYGNIDVQLWADSSVSPSHGISGSNAVFSFGGSITSLTVGGQTVIHAGNVGFQSVSYASSAGNADTVDGYHATAFPYRSSGSSGYYQVADWIQMNTNAGIYWPSYNGAHIYPNTSTSYGSIRIDGSRNSWRGITFDGTVTLMMNDNESGHYKDGYGWQFRWYNGTLYCSKNSYGGGTEGVVLDSANFTSYAINRGGDTVDSIIYFRTNNGYYSGSTNSAKLQAFCTGADQSAFMSFHRSGYYAINMGLDGDNVFRIGGWSASANRFQMDMSGNLTMAGDVTAYSDARVKTDVETITGALNKVSQLRGVSYKRTDSDDTRTKIGVIAQETLPIVPEVVNQDNFGMYNVSYGNFAGLFIEAIKEQQAQITAQSAQITELMEIIKTMKGL